MNPPIQVAHTVNADITDADRCSRSRPTTAKRDAQHSHPTHIPHPAQ